MKKLIFFISLLIISSGNLFTQSGWFWQNPLPQGNELYTMHINNNVIYAAGAYGIFIKSTNNGNTWTNTSFQSNLYFKSVFFISNLKGWLLSSRNVFSTTNSGGSWKSDTITNSGNLSDVYFANEQTGYIVTESGKIFKSVNGGLIWSLSFSGTSMGFTKCYFLNDLTGWAAGYNGKFFKTTNGGTNWSEIITGVSNRISAIQFRNINYGWVAYENGGLLITTNGGTNWNYNVVPGYIPSLCFVNDLTGWISGLEIMKTTDGGFNWTTQTGNGNLLLNSIRFLNDQTGFASGVNGRIMRTTNGGTNWNYISSNSTENKIHDVYFVNENSGWAAGENGTIIYTSNSGSNWNLQHTANSVTFSSIRFLNQFTGWVSGSGIYRTTNAGFNWIQIMPSQSVTSIFPVDNNVVFGCGYSGLIMKTTNAGSTWTYYPPVFQSFYDIFFINSNTGWVAGSGEIILKTTNGGVNWTNIRGGNMIGQIYDIQFVTEFIGFASINNAVTNDIIMTGNGGVSWYSIFSKTGSFITSFYFRDMNTGWLVSDYVVYKTSNAGQNWESHEQGIPQNNTSIFFVNENTGWLTGDYGAVLKTTTGGTVIGIHKYSEEIAECFSLHQNYPNPFNPVTKISFDIPLSHLHLKGGDKEGVKLIIYDLLGREISTLVNEQLQPGSYSVDWDASGYASGVYFYSLITNEFTETKHMVLIK